LSFFFWNGGAAGVIWLVATLLAPALLSVLIAPVPGVRLRSRLTAVAAWACLAAALGLVLRFDTSSAGLQFGGGLSWWPEMGVRLHFGLDGLALPVFLLPFLAFPVAAAGLDSTARAPGIALGGLISCAAAAVASQDAYAFVFFYLMCAGPALILGLSSEGSRREVLWATRAWLFGAVLLVVALQGLRTYGQALGYGMVVLEVAEIGPSVRWWFLFLLVGLGLGAGLWPLHGGLMAAGRSRSPILALLFAAVLSKVALFGLLRIGVGLMPAGAAVWANFWALLAALTALAGGLLAWRCRTPAGLLTSTAVAHGGVAMLGFATLSQAGIAGGVLHLVAHGLVALVLHGRPPGVRSPMDSQAGPGLASLVLAGAPLLLSFWSLAVVVLAAGTLHPATSLAAVAGAALAVVATMAPHAVAEDRARPERVLVLIVVVGLVVFGVWPGPLFEVVDAAAAALVGGLP
jgi:NADH-quinone oxidoreductase subunit M